MLIGSQKKKACYFVAVFSKVLLIEFKYIHATLTTFCAYETKQH